MKTVTLAPRGTRRKVEQVDQLHVPDLWHIAMWLQENEPQIHNHLRGQTWSEAILETWHLAHDLLENIRNPKLMS